MSACGGAVLSSGDEGLCTGMERACAPACGDNARCENEIGVPAAAGAGHDSQALGAWLPPERGS
jgi:hypothetical protein